MEEITYFKIKPHAYAIERDGRVYSYYKQDYMKTSIDKDGYITVSLVTNNGKSSHFGIHRLLLLTYCPCDNMENLTVNHIDGNKFNNDFSNLEWVTSAENVRLAHQTGLNNTVGENHGKSKLTEAQAKRVIELSKKGKNLKEIRFEVPSLNKNMLNLIKHGHTWKHLPR